MKKLLDDEDEVELGNTSFHMNISEISNLTADDTSMLNVSVID